jgi:phospholipid-binding lipoprotein MlaA
MFKILVLCFFTAMLSGAANAQSYNGTSETVEDINRIVFDGNVLLDDVVLEPIAQGYRAISTPGVRKAVSNFSNNLDEPRNFINALLQGDLQGGGDSLTRFLVNSTFGIVGLLDVAGRENVARQEEDFGQTLAVWGADSGTYLMLPVLGPSNVRDLSGRVVDTVTSPIGFLARQTNITAYEYGAKGLGIVSSREANIENIESIRRSTLDYYAAVRSFYNQRRQNAIANIDSGENTAARDKAFENF